MTAHSTLGLDADELASCVGCGLCLPHCPTFRVTGEEGYSPRGRIDAMRAVEWRGAPIDDTFEEFMSTCVQCRGCEPACPSGVPFGHLMESTRDALDQVGRGVPGLVKTVSAGARSPSCGARRVDGPGRRAAGSSRTAAAGRAAVCRCGAVPPLRATGRRRVDFHRLCDGCVDARHAPGHRRAGDGAPVPDTPCRVETARAAAPCTVTLGWPPTPGAGPKRRSDRCPAAHRSWSIRRDVGRR